MLEKDNSPVFDTCLKIRWTIQDNKFFFLFHAGLGKIEK